MHVAGFALASVPAGRVGFVVASVILFIWFWPILTAAPLTDAAFKLRYWFTDAGPDADRLEPRGLNARASGRAARA